MGKDIRDMGEEEIRAQRDIRTRFGYKELYEIVCYRGWLSI